MTPWTPDALEDQSGRIAIVTGANTGLGFETAKALARLGMTTVMACRTEARALEAQARIEAEVAGARLVFMPLDLSDLARVRRFAEQLRAAFSTLDILVLNAGIMTPPYARTVDGFESQMGANYFGHFLLTSLLLDLMPDTPASRVVTLSSAMHKLGERRIVFEDLNWEKKYSASGAYAQSKLACLMFACALDRHLKAAGRSIVALSAHPGMSLTELDRSGSGIYRLFNTVMRLTLAPFFAQTARQGALPQLRAALDHEARGGTYYGPTGFQEFKGPPDLVQPLPYALDVAEQDRLWAVSTAATGAVFPWGMTAAHTSAQAGS